MAGNPKSKKRLRRGYMLMMLTWSVAAFALMTQVYLAQGMTGLRIASWQYQDVQARHYAEAALNEIVNFYNHTGIEECAGWQKLSFGLGDWGLDGGGACTLPGQAHPCDCQVALTGASGELTKGKLVLRAMNNMAAGNTDIMLAYRIKNGGAGIKNISVKAYRDFNSPNPRAIAEVSQQIVLISKIHDGLIGINSVSVGASGNVNGNIAVLSPAAPNAVSLPQGSWVQGKVLVGPLPSGFSPANLIGDKLTTNLIVMGDGAAIMDADPSVCCTTTADRVASIESYSGVGAAKVIDPLKKTVADMTHVVSGAPFADNIKQAMDELSHTLTPDQIIANAGLNPATDCTDKIEQADFLPRSITVPNGVTKMCFQYIDVGKNVTVTFSSPVTVYIKGYKMIGTNSPVARSVNMGASAEFKALDSNSLPINNGVTLKIANSDSATNLVYIDRLVNFYGGIYAPESRVKIEAFANINGSAVLARDLDIAKMANVPKNNDNFISHFGIASLNGWIDRPDIE